MLKFTRILILLSLAIWIVVSMAALAGMYKLWWDRERVEYLGKTIAEQRQKVFKRAGMSLSLLDRQIDAEKSWSRDARYSTTGDLNQLSYVKYLLIPRIPSGSETYSFDTTSGVSPDSQKKQTSSGNKNHRGPQGFFLSLLIVTGFGMALQKRVTSVAFSLPEMTGCSLLLITGIVVLSRGVFFTAVPGFVGLLFLGTGCWLYVFSSVVRRSKEIFSKFCRRQNQIKVNAKSVWLTVLLGIICLSVVWSFIMAVVVVPDDWDAWAIWGAKAKVLALGTGSLHDVSYFGHADYPLLWPSVWALSGWLNGGWDELWGKGWGSVFYLLCVWEIVVIVKRITYRGDIALLAGALFSSMPLVPLIASWGYAEPPFWFLIISCVGCLLLRSQNDALLLTIIAGILAAAAAYTKNEGLLFSVLAAGWILIIPGKHRVKNMLLFIGVVVICYFPWFYWIKIVYAFGSHATGGLHFDHENLGRVAGRIPKAFETIGRLWSDIRQWNVVLWLSIITVFCSIFKRDFFMYLILPVGLILGYLTITVFHTAEIYWQLGTSWNRLTLHAMPLMSVFLVIQLCRTFFSGTIER